MNPQKNQGEQWETLCRSEIETCRLGAAIAATLQPGDVLALVGNLGAGKTRLVQAVAEALGVDRRAVTSPTFVLIQEYAGRLPIYHFDTYRLPDIDAFLEIGAEEFLAGEGVCLIEWADRVQEILPSDHLRIDIAATGPTERRFQLTAGTGARSKDIVLAIRREMTLPSDE